MLRRPLTAPDPTEDEILNASFLSLHFRGVFPPCDPRSANPSLVLEADMRSVAYLLGFDEPPASPLCRYPEKPLPGQHPTMFLQWGWARKGDRQIIFDLGGANSITRFHFMKTSRRALWHLDFIDIDVGDEVYKIPCADPGWAVQRATFLGVAACAVAALNEDDWRQAESLLKAAVRRVIHGPEDPPIDVPVDFDAIRAQIGGPRP